MSPSMRSSVTGFKNYKKWAFFIRDGRIYVKLAPFGGGENANEIDDVKSRVDVKSSIFAPELVIQIVNHSCLMT